MAVGWGRLAVKTKGQSLSVELIETGPGESQRANPMRYTVLARVTSPVSPAACAVPWRLEVRHIAGRRQLWLQGTRCYVLTDGLPGLLGSGLRWLGQVTPGTAEHPAALTLVLCDHGCHHHHSHDQEDHKENNCNHEDGHTSPRGSFCRGANHLFRDCGHKWV